MFYLPYVQNTGINYQQVAPALFSFSEKKGKLNWNMVEETDVDQLILNVDINKLEHLLQNLTYCNLDKQDLKRIKDKNLIKLFKLGQLTVEYLLYTQKYTDHLSEGLEREYQSHYGQTAKLEESVLQNQREINALKRDLKIKKQTLRTYENLLKQPKGVPVEVAKCQLCLKFFANNDYLVSHYKKRHRDFYIKEIRDKENQMMNREEGEMEKPFNEDDFLVKMREEVVDKVSSNFVHLQMDIDNLKRHTKADKLEEFINQKPQAVLEAQVQEVKETIKTYEIMIEEFKNEMKQQIEGQDKTLQNNIKEAIQKFLEEEENKGKEEDEVKKKEEQIQNALKARIEKEMMEAFENRFKQFEFELSQKDQKIKLLEQSFSQDEQKQVAKEQKLIEEEVKKEVIEQKEGSMNDPMIEVLKKELENQKRAIEEERKRSEEQMKLVQDQMEQIKKEKPKPVEVQKHLQEEEKDESQKQKKDGKKDKKEKSEKKNKKEKKVKEEEEEQKRDGSNRKSRRVKDLIKEMQMVQGGKESRAGFFEDDEQEVPIVRKISYVESPPKDKKKKKKDKKKNKSKSKEKSKVEVKYEEEKEVHDKEVQEQEISPEKAKEEIIVVEKVEEEKLDNMQRLKQQLKDSQGIQKDLEEEKKDSLDDSTQKQKREKRGKKESSRQSTKKKHLEVIEEDQEEHEGTEHSIHYDNIQKLQQQHPFLAHKYKDQALKTIFKHSNSDYDTMKGQLSEQFNKLLSNMGYMKSHNSLTTQESSNISQICQKHISKSINHQIKTSTQTLISCKRTKEEQQEYLSREALGEIMDKDKKTEQQKPKVEILSQESYSSGDEEEEMKRTSNIRKAKQKDQESPKPKESASEKKGNSNSKKIEEHKNKIVEDEWNQQSSLQKQDSPSKQKTQIEEKKVPAQELSEEEKLQKQFEDQVRRDEEALLAQELERKKNEERERKEKEEKLKLALEEKANKEKEEKQQLEQIERERKEKLEREIKEIKPEPKDQNLKDDKEEEEKKASQLRKKWEDIQSSKISEKIQNQEPEISQEKEEAKKEVQESPQIEIQKGQTLEILNFSQESDRKEPVKDKAQVLLIGDQHIGKSSLAKLLTSDKLVHFKCSETQNLYYYDSNEEFQIVDTPGRDLYHSKVNETYSQCNCIIVAFNSEDEKSFINIKTKWMINIQKLASKSIAKAGIILVGISTQQSDEDSLFQSRIALFSKGYDLVGKYVNVNLNSGNGKSKLIQLIKETIKQTKDFQYSSQPQLREEPKEIEQIMKEGKKEESKKMGEIEDIINKYNQNNSEKITIPQTESKPPVLSEQKEERKTELKQLPSTTKVEIKQEQKAAEAPQPPNQLAGKKALAKNDSDYDDDFE